jgi:hypothetical protein
MRQEQPKRVGTRTRRLSLNLPLVEDKPGGSWVIAPKQMHNLLTAYWACRRETAGPDLDLTIEVVEDVGPVPCDYAVLMLDIIDECVGYIGYRTDGTPSVEVRLSEMERYAGLSDFVLDIVNRGPKLPRSRVLSDGLLRLRDRTAEWNGSLEIDQSCLDRISFRAALPIVSLSY